jgi:hypothetical protein
MSYHVQNSQEGTLAVSIDGLPGGITIWSCLVNMGTKIPIRVLNVRNEKVHPVVGTRQGRLCETRDAVAVLPTCQKPETVHVLQVFCQTAIENILAHLTELQEKPSLSRTVSQVQNLANLLCQCQGVFGKAEYDLGTYLLPWNKKIYISEANLKGPPAHWTSLNFQVEEVEEASEVLETQGILRSTYLSLGRLQKQIDQGLVVPLKNPV